MISVHVLYEINKKDISGMLKTQTRKTAKSGLVNRARRGLRSVVSKLPGMSGFKRHGQSKNIVQRTNQQTKSNTKSNEPIFKIPQTTKPDKPIIKQQQTTNEPIFKIPQTTKPII